MPPPKIIKTLIALVTICMLLYVFKWFLMPAAMAVWVCVAIWPSYEKLLAAPRLKKWAPGLAALTVAAAVIGPLSWASYVISTEVSELYGMVGEKLASKIEVPSWIANLPVIGPKLTMIAAKEIGRLEESLQLDAGAVLSATGSFGMGALQMLGAFAAWILFLWPLLRHGEEWSKATMQSAKNLGGEPLIKALQEQAMLMRACFNGIIVLGLLEGSLFWLLYSGFDVRQPAFWGMATGFAASIPLASPLIVLGISGGLFLSGEAGPAIAVGAVGLGFLLIADPLIRPAVSGRGVEIGFVAMLVGMFGGMQTLGLAGIVLGPMLVLGGLQIFKTVSLSVKR